MVILATFFPTYEVPAGKIDLHGELMKGAVELFDLVGLFLIISQQIGRGDLKILVAGVGELNLDMYKIYNLYLKV